MNILLIVLILLLNYGISWFNAWSVGRSWADSKAIGGWPRFMVWCGAVMSACGFTWCYIIPLALIAGLANWLKPDYVQATLELGYVIIILPILGSGLAIWMDSLTTAWRRRDMRSIGVAGWNTFAMAHNTYSAAKTLPGIFKHLGEVFKGKGGKDKAIMLVLLLVIIALSAGILTTRAIILSTARKYGQRVREEFPQN